MDFLKQMSYYKTALHSYRRRVNGYPQFEEDIKRIDIILETLD